MDERTWIQDGECKKYPMHLCPIFVCAICAWQISLSSKHECVDAFYQDDEAFDMNTWQIGWFLSGSAWMR
eukprot:scaffold986_cov23-Tisochrysis_lutea.AAC.2